MKKITSEDCINEIHKILPGEKWKRISKTTVIERLFEMVGQPGVKALVREEGGKLEVSLNKSPKIDNPIKKLNKEDYYFHYDPSMEDDADGPSFPAFDIVSKKFWDDHHHFDETVNCTNVNMPHGFTECMEGVFEFDGKKDVAISKLLAAGFLPIPERRNISNTVLSGILFGVIPGTRNGSEDPVVWFADKDKFLNNYKHGPDADVDLVLTYEQRKCLNEAMEKAGFVGGEVEDGADGFSLEYRIENWIGHCALISANDVRETLRKLGFSEDPKYAKWVFE